MTLFLQLCLNNSGYGSQHPIYTIFLFPVGFQIPDRLSVAMLESAGVQMENSDPRLARLISLAGQKFLTDILSDAMLHWRLANGQPTGLLNHPSVSTSIPGQASNPSSINPITTPTSNPSQSIPQSPSSSKYSSIYL